VNQLLTDLEKHDGLVVMATNRPQDLDEAMHRRITVAIEFESPDATLREQIWRRHIPPGLPTDALDLRALAVSFELTGATGPHRLASRARATGKPPPCARRPCPPRAGG
jgi:SpoVK/Ycf46/Vps4 family AAA+-type ATPase